jgi:sigma-B regulation protein RsbU (phosphoserine phosphatase)
LTAVDLLAFATAVVICTASGAAIVGHVFRSPPKDRLLLWFGLFSGVYGVRMFFKPPLASPLGVHQSTAAWVVNGLTYVILIPALLFSEELYGLGWRRSLRWVTTATAAFAIGAIAVDIVVGNPSRVPEPTLVVFALIVVVVVLGARAGYSPPRFDEAHVLAAGFATFMLFVFHEHAVTARFVPWRFGAEPVGFLALLGSLGYIALTRVVAQGRQLAAVDQEMRSAREIQTSILPRDLPSIRGFQIAARYVPLAAVAGDFYDVVALDNGGVVVLIADVSGHGVPAALIASMVKVAFGAALRETADPGAILRVMNTTLCGMFERSYVTAACVVIRPDVGILTYALAGHPPPLLLPEGDGHVVLLDERGLFLGFTLSATYTTSTVPIRPRARLIVYSDGVTETPAADDDLFGIDRLSRFAALERERPPDAFADALMAALESFADRKALPHDDVTLVVVDADVD